MHFVNRILKDQSGQVLPMMLVMIPLFILVFSMIITIGQKEYVNTKAQMIADSASLAAAATATPVQSEVWIGQDGSRANFPKDYRAEFDDKGNITGYTRVSASDYWALAGYNIDPNTAQSAAEEMIRLNEQNGGSPGETAQLVGIVKPSGTVPAVQGVRQPPPSFGPNGPAESDFQSYQEPQLDGSVVNELQARPIVQDVLNGSPAPPMQVDVKVNVTEPSLFNWLFTFFGEQGQEFLGYTAWSRAFAMKSPADINYAQGVGSFNTLNKQGYSY